MDCSLPGSSVHGICQARVLEWGAIAFSRTNLDRVLKSRDITWSTKFHLVKAMVFPVVMYGCESWTVKKAESESHLVVSDSLQSNELYSLWNFPGQNTGVGSHSLLQGIFPTQESNPGIWHCRWILYHLSQQGSWRKAECQRTDAFKLWCWRRLFRVPLTSRSNQSILKEINSEYSLEGLMMKLKLQYFGHLMRRTDWRP